MKLMFLGTGPAVGIPRPEHDDPACQDALRGGKSRRTRSSALLIHQNTTVLFDAGPDLEEQFVRARVKKLDGVFLTHGHADACGGLRLLNQWISRQPHAWKLPVVTDAVTQNRLERRFGKLSCLQWIAVEPYTTVRIGSLACLAAPVEHSSNKRFPTSAFVFDKRFAYASDVADIPPETQERLHGVRTLVLDGAYYFQKKFLPSHLTTDQAIGWGKRIGVRYLVLTQIGHSYPPHAEAERDVAEHLRAHKIKTPRRVTLAFDGLTLHV